jgi:hypothetical protein
MLPAVESAIPQEAVMGQSIPRQHPAVVLRSHYLALRGLLAVAMVAVVVLASTVVVLASDDDVASGGGSATQVLPERVGGTIGEHSEQRRAAIGGKAHPAWPLLHLRNPGR